MIGGYLCIGKKPTYILFSLGKNIYVHCVGVDHSKQAGYKISMSQLATFVSAELNARYMCDYAIWLH